MTPAHELVYAEIVKETGCSYDDAKYAFQHTADKKNAIKLINNGIDVYKERVNRRTEEIKDEYYGLRNTPRRTDLPLRA